jgi:hypothetical protein
MSSSASVLLSHKRNARGRKTVLHENENENENKNENENENKNENENESEFERLRVEGWSTHT